MTVLVRQEPLLSRKEIHGPLMSRVTSRPSNKLL